MRKPAFQPIKIINMRFFVFLYCLVLCKTLLPAQAPLSIYWNGAYRPSFQPPHTRWAANADAADVVITTTVNPVGDAIKLSAQASQTSFIQLDTLWISQDSFASPKALGRALLRLLLPHWANQKSSRQIIRYDLPMEDNERHVDAFGLWAFSAGFDGTFNWNSRSDRDPRSGAVSITQREYVLKPSLGAFRMGRVYRHTTTLDFWHRKSRQTQDQTTTGSNRNVLFIDHQSMFQIRDHLAVGALLSWNNDNTIVIGPDFSFGNEGLSAGVGVEGNIFRYRDFYRRYWIIGAQATQNHFDGVSANIQCYTEAASLTPWGFWKASMRYNAAPENDFSGPKRRFQVVASINYNIRGGWYLTVGGEFNRLYFDNPFTLVTSNQQTFQVDWGIDYFFGRGRSNVLNPRIRRI